jgi:hypothetical protein
MVTLRCTKKLLQRGLVQSADDDVPPSTMLGNWYANIVFSRPQHLVVCVSERTLLPVVVAARDLKSLPQRLAVATHELLLALDIAPDLADMERHDMQAVRIGRTCSKTILGSLNDMVHMLEFAIRDRPDASLLLHSLWLARSPCKPIEYASPDTFTQALFQSTAVIDRIRTQEKKQGGRFA